MRMTPLAFALAFFAINAHAQLARDPGPAPAAPVTAPAAPAPAATLSQEVARLAPQLIPFAGSRGNFESLVTGLALGIPVTLTTVGANGLVQTTTFALPAGAQTDAVQIARTLETARQQLISQGIATPTAQQLGETISGTPVPVSVTALPPTVAPNTPGVQPPAVPGTGAAGGSVPSPARQLQQRSNPDIPRVNTSDSRNLDSTSASPVPPTAPTVARQPPPPRVTSSPALPLPAR